MEQSRRAVESYWRSRMVDGATSDEDKVTPVYKLEEICDLLRSSHPSIVKEVSEFILKRLDHKSSIVKQKALRVIKYAVGKSGAEFRREMQRNSVAVRQLIHYRGQPDPLKGDALNKAVRETAQETLSVLFTSDESKAAPKESKLGSRIQGFGNTNYELPSEDKRSFINEIVDIGSATIKQGLSSLAQSPSLRKNNDTGSYRSPNLQRSLAPERDHSERYEAVDYNTDMQSSSRFSKNAGSGSWGQDLSASQAETSDGVYESTYGTKTREEKLLETIVTSGGVRLQPPRDALHSFLIEASKLDALSLAHAIETKLNLPMWQVRMKAICVLEAVLRKKDDGKFSVISSYFSDNSDAVIQCSESPQASLREKANKVLSLLSGEKGGGGINQVERSAQPLMMPDLLDTSDSHDLMGVEDSQKADVQPSTSTVGPSNAPLIDDLLGDSFGGGDNTNWQKVDDDPFADVSFHSSLDKDHETDVFSGMAVNKSVIKDAHVAANRTESASFDFYNSTSQELENAGKDVNDLMSSLSINRNEPFEKQNGSTTKKSPEHVHSASSIPQENNIHNSILSREFTSQTAGINVAPMFPLGAMGYNFPSGLMFNPALASHAMNNIAMENILAQPQFLAAMSNFQQQGYLQSSTGFSAAGSDIGNSSAFPDVFNSTIATQPPTSLMNDSKREDTRAFDFISDHLAAARDPKHVT
ncbi:protein MODIFIED TRANSPORT TO THE VACUOLE 1-like isoform X2 [Salvia miltiorrhiza]|uniref:protein MODIFIED TRANSPORT TO THE VACUOLE 1-like isoform X2 n=2 Tax=Salvia miltiorrhiza TaxID=226208 RepID=UPI0025AD0767|nr:protein MODIFIED TRANSPORT TO THE VACUOLE 1-like isoform X2 [Salvia miltiorrhiza]